MTWIMRLARGLCLLGRHRPEEAGAWFLGEHPTRCGRCGKRLTGWDQDGIGRPRVTCPGDPARFRLPAPAQRLAAAECYDVTDLRAAAHAGKVSLLDLELAAILADLDEAARGRRMH